MTTEDEALEHLVAIAVAPHRLALDRGGSYFCQGCDWYRYAGAQCDSIGEHGEHVRLVGVEFRDWAIAWKAAGYAK